MDHTTGNEPVTLNEPYGDSSGFFSHSLSTQRVTRCITIVFKCNQVRVKQHPYKLDTTTINEYDCCGKDKCGVITIAVEKLLPSVAKWRCSGNVT